MNKLSFVIAFSIPMLAIAEWKVPQRPNPQVILNEARADARAGRFEDALAKHLWFHHHVLEHNPSFSGVRLSFALMYWHELGKVYPPALEKLTEIRDQAARQAVARKGNARQAFMDMRAINDELGEIDGTVTAFVRLDKDAPNVAKEVYDLAQPALVKAKKFALCGKYLDPEKSYANLARFYDFNRKIAKKKDSVARKSYQHEFAERHFIEQSATLVALLVLNDRKSDADKIAADARSKSQHPSRDTMIDAALQGKIPEDDSESGGTE